jgi:hypothetical protein
MSTLVTWSVLRLLDVTYQCIDSHQKGSLRTGRKGYSGISHMGPMTNSLLLVAWPDGTAVKTAFTFAA